jgi:hypothetical protein
MRKLILISAFVLASISAQAGDSRGLLLAANDEVKVAEAATPQQATATATSTDGAKPQASSSQPAKSSKKAQARRRETDEQKAHRIAAKYGVYW